MKTEKDIREKILEVTDSYRHVLDRGPATTDINSPVALMQIQAVAQLSILYWIIGEHRPHFTCDDNTKTNY